MFNGAVSLKDALDSPGLDDVVISMYRAEMEKKVEYETAQSAQDVIRRLRGS